MNVGQAKYLIKTMRKITKKKCGMCREKRQWSITAVTIGHVTNYYVTCKCSCDSTTWTNFDDQRRV